MKPVTLDESPYRPSLAYTMQGELSSVVTTLASWLHDR